MRVRRSFVMLTTAIALAGALLLGGGSVSGAQSGTSTSAKQPIVIGQIASITMPQNPGRRNTFAGDTLNAWAKATKQINGHKIVVKVVDDTYDPAGASAAIKQLINQDHVIAIVGESAPNTISVWAPIAAAAHVPVIGGDAVSTDWTSNPILFPVTTTSVTDGLYGNVNVVKQAGYKNFGITYTTTSPAAAAAGPFFKTLATNAGLNFTVNLPVNETDPDFTAACLALKQSKTQAFFPATAGTELPRMARDCARQNYFPAYTLNTFSVGNNEILTDPNIKDVIAASNAFPEPITNTSATKEFHAAMNKYAPKVLKSDEKTASTIIWTAAKMFQQAASLMTSNAPTSEDMLNALYQVKNETLGGLAPAPLTYTAGAASNPHVPCWFVMQIKHHKLVAPQGMKTNCVPPK